MNDLDSQINKVTNPDEAVAEFVGEQFVSWAKEYIQHALKSSAPMVALSSSRPNQAQLRKFLLQIFPAEHALLGGVDGDPGFLGFVIANLSESADPEAESALEILEKRQNDPTLPPKETLVASWATLLGLVGSGLDEAGRTKPKEGVRLFIAELSDLLSTSDWQTALGAFVTYEWAMIELLKATIPMIAATVGSAQVPATLESRRLDERHSIDIGHLLDNVIFDREDKQLVWSGVHRQLQNQTDFLASLVKYLN